LVRGRASGRVAWRLCALSAMLGVGTVVRAVLNQTSLRDFVVDYAAIGPVVGISSPLLGALIIARYPDNRIGWVLYAIGVGLAVTMAGAEYARYTLLTRPGYLPGGGILGWIYNWSWMSVLGLLPFLFLLFPDGRLRSRRWRPVALLAVVSTVVPPAVVAVVGWPYLGPELWFSEELLAAGAPEFERAGWNSAATARVEAATASSDCPSAGSSSLLKPNTPTA
jgi:hypothetical protein